MGINRDIYMRLETREKPNYETKSQAMIDYTTGFNSVAERIRSRRIKRNFNSLS